MPSQQINLRIKGLYTAPNDFSGVPDGALDVADNVNIDQESLAEPRRGFALTGFLPLSSDRVTAFSGYQGVRIFAYGTDQLGYDAGAGPITYTGSYPPPDPDVADVRFVEANKNLYFTTAQGLYKLDSYTATPVKAGVPKGLDLQLALSGTSGFMTPKIAVSVTGKTVSGANTLSLLSDTGGIFIGQYVAGTGITSGTKVSSITPSAVVLITTGTTAAGTTDITVMGSTAGLAANQLIQGTGIPTGARISSILSGTSVRMDRNAIASGTGVNVTFSSEPIITMSLNATASATGVNLDFSAGSQVAYRLVWGIRDANSNVVLSAPSQFATITNDTGATRNVTATSSVPVGITLNHFYQLYRSNQTAGADITPLDDLQLVYEGNPVGTDLTNGYVTIADITPDSLRGASLYTSTSQQGISQANDNPPLCHDMCVFKNCVLYANTTTPQRKNLTVLAVGAPNGIQSGHTLTIGGTTYTAGAAENIATNTFKVVTTGTPAQNIADTVNSLIRVINRSTSNTTVYAYLLSGPTDLPGQILLEEKGVGAAAFALTGSNGAAFNPSLPTSGSTVTSIQSVNKNGIIISKASIPEAAPGIQLLFAGSASKDILRIIPLRDYVVILKQDGVFRLSGNTISTFTITPFDLTTKLIAPNTAVSLSNEVWGLFDQGVCSVSDTGVNVRSRNIEDTINNLITTALPTLRTVAFGVGYETDRKYILSLPISSGDTYCQQQYVFPTFTSAWSRWTRACTAGFIDPASNKLFLGNAYNSISEERKTNSYRDYVDEPFSVNIVSFTENVVTLTSALGITVGDVLYSSTTKASVITAVDTVASTVTVQDPWVWTVGASSVFPAVTGIVQWKPIVAGNPAFVRQYADGAVMFKRTKFNEAGLSFYSDVQQAFQAIPLTGPRIGTWGSFPWGQENWGGINRPKGIRFTVPREMQMASQLSIRLTIRAGYSNWACEGVAVSISNANQEIAN